jgi:hypothetical protein
VAHFDCSRSGHTSQSFCFRHPFPRHRERGTEEIFAQILIKILLELQIWECYARGWTWPGDSLSLKALDRLF